ncbi:DNA cytosine methyltransferase [Thalassovita mangrovi]|uniref:Cytosine-specific methyltransferase n=1 Tax=Thalassovita mangrovi TaxID=2692236 RepID=A0A6L8LES9_9RHOB|nr:DNA cytosine methyltransferase [Thalassovita mangrovi]MYM54438.1 DNA (cytosine-5-)-methyltransferase [Thalassovita mangrovi]
MFDLTKKNGNKPNFIDLFAGAGGLSEGFVRAGCEPIAHVEADTAAACTLRTREAFHVLRGRGDLSGYFAYLSGQLSRDEFYSLAFGPRSSSVINAEIGAKSLSHIFNQLDIQIGDRKLDLIVGGPPCQAYSLVGRARSEQKMVGDKRNYLFVYYAEFLRRYRPKFFIFENVVGLLTAREADGTRYFDMMWSLFKDLGYTVEYQVIAADEYGIPQKRKRIILVGRRGKKDGFFPELEKIPTDFLVEDAIGDLPSLRAGKGVPSAILLENPPSRWLAESGLLSADKSTTWHEARPHNPRDLKIFKKVVNRWNKNGERLSYNDLPESLKTHKNRSSFLDRFKVVAADLPASHTVVAHIAKDGNYYIHPDNAQNRSLTPREAARLQTFPDDFYFEGASGKPSRTSAFKQIGNAVPVLLAEKISQKLVENWS